MTPLAARRRVLALLHAAFFLTGNVTVLLGPLLPELRGRRGLADEQIALLFVAQFAASSLGAVLSSLRLRLSVLTGYALMAAGLVLLTHGAWPRPLAAMAFVGLSLGLAIPASNLVVARLTPERRTAALSTLNFAWGLGAVSCPLLFAALVERLPAAAGLWLLAAMAALFALVLARALHALDCEAAPASAAASPPSPAGVAPGSGRADAALFALPAVQLFLYVGTESTIGGWIVALAAEAGAHDMAALLVDAGFWAALLTGRALTPLLLRRVSETALHAASLALALAGGLALAVVTTPAALAAAGAAAGAGLAALFPLIVARLAAHAEERRSRRSGWVFAFAGLGGAALPWLAGRWIAVSGSVREGFAVPVAGLVALAALCAAQRRHGARQAPRTAPQASRAKTN